MHILLFPMVFSRHFYNFYDYFCSMGRDEIFYSLEYVYEPLYPLLFYLHGILIYSPKMCQIVHAIINSDT